MSDAPVQTQAGLEAQPPLPARRLHTFISGPPRNRLTEVVHAQSAALDDAFEGANRDRFASVHGHDDLPAVGMTPFLMAAFLAYLREAIPPENSNHILGGANWKPLAHASATLRTFAPLRKRTGEGSNHNANASLALRTASSSLSPAEAQPGSSGKKAAQRLVSGSCSTINRSFMGVKIPPGRQRSKPTANLYFVRGFHL